jgi:hypothetical protein
MSGSENVVLERLWVHDTGDRGIDVENVLGSTSATVRGTLVERATGHGVYALGVTVTLEDIVVRDTLLDGDNRGRGIAVQGDDAGAAASLVLTHGLVERSREHGLFLSGVTAGVSRTLVRTTQPASGERHGRGIHLQPQSVALTPSELTLTQSVIEDSHEAGIVIGASRATIEATVVRGTALDAAGVGSGIILLGDPVAGRSEATLHSSLFAASAELGVVIYGAAATLDHVVVRDTAAGDDGFGGHGIHVEGMQGVETEATVTATLIERSHIAGIVVSGATLRVEQCVVSGTVANADGLFGDGLLAGGKEIAANITLLGVVLSDNARAGIANFGSEVALGGSVLSCHAFDLNGELFEGRSFTFADLGGSLCGCPEPSAPCGVSSSGILAPRVPDLPTGITD